MIKISEHIYQTTAFIDDVTITLTLLTTDSATFFVDKTYYQKNCDLGYNDSKTIQFSDDFTKNQITFENLCPLSNYKITMETKKKDFESNLNSEFFKSSKKLRIL